MKVFRVINLENPPPSSKWYTVHFDKNDKQWNEKQYFLRDKIGDILIAPHGYYITCPYTPNDKVYEVYIKTNVPEVLVS
jgi:hypothetical protein